MLQRTESLLPEWQGLLPHNKRITPGAAPLPATRRLHGRGAPGIQRKCGSTIAATGNVIGKRAERTTAAGGSTPALRFSSRDPEIGATRELWFVRNDYLYHVTMYAAHQEWLDAWIRGLALNLHWES